MSLTNPAPVAYVFTSKPAVSRSRRNAFSTRVSSSTTAITPRSSLMCEHYRARTNGEIGPWSNAGATAAGRSAVGARGRGDARAFGHADERRDGVGAHLLQDARAMDLDRLLRCP